MWAYQPGKPDAPSAGDWLRFFSLRGGGRCFAPQFPDQATKAWECREEISELSRVKVRNKLLQVYHSLFHIGWGVL